MSWQGSCLSSSIEKIGQGYLFSTNADEQANLSNYIDSSDWVSEIWWIDYWYFVLPPRTDTREFTNNDNVDKLFVKELQTTPHILKLYIWKISHFTLVLSGSLVVCPSSGANIQPLARNQVYTGLNTRICMRVYKSQLSSIMDLVILKIWVQIWTPQTTGWSNKTVTCNISLTESKN